MFVGRTMPFCYTAPKVSAVQEVEHLITLTRKIQPTSRLCHVINYFVLRFLSK